MYVYVSAFNYVYNIIAGCVYAVNVLVCLNTNSTWMRCMCTVFVCVFMCVFVCVRACMHACVHACALSADFM